jgi:hypothetical protein
MQGTAELLTAYENCPRAGYWAQFWERSKGTSLDFLQYGIRKGLTESKRTDYGEVAGEYLYELGASKQLDSKQLDIHAEIVHLSAISDIVTTALRKKVDAPWRVPETIPEWTPTCYLSPNGDYLRRVVFTTSWSDEKHYSFCRAWQTLGPVCHYSLPMQLAVIILGQHKNGKYHSFWTHGLRHPANKKLRFRKKQDIRTPFKEGWNEVWREDFDDISTNDWLAAMLEDDVLRDICFSLTVPVPEELARKNIVDLAYRKMESIRNIKVTPDPNLSTCDWPLPCIFRNPCHQGKEPNGRFGFISLDNIEKR